MIEKAFLILISAATAVGSGFLASRIAEKKGAGDPFWFVAGLLTGPLAVAGALLARRRPRTPDKP